MPNQQEMEVRRVLAGFAPVWKRVTGVAQEPDAASRPRQPAVLKKPHPTKKPHRRPTVVQPALCPAAPIVAALLLLRSGQAPGCRR